MELGGIWYFDIFCLFYFLSPGWGLASKGRPFSPRPPASTYAQVYPQPGASYPQLAHSLFNVCGQAHRLAHWFTYVLFSMLANTDATAALDGRGRVVLGVR